MANSVMNWETVRDPKTNNISLSLAWVYYWGEHPPAPVEKYLKDIERLCPISSRQAAAIALTTAHRLFFDTSVKRGKKLKEGVSG